jgi:hypothetical protein
VPAGAASALVIHDTDGSLCSAFARALLWHCSVNLRPVDRTGFPHGRKGRCNGAVTGGPGPAGPPAIPRWVPADRQNRAVHSMVGRLLTVVLAIRFEFWDATSRKAKPSAMMSC